MRIINTHRKTRSWYLLFSFLFFAQHGFSQVPAKYWIEFTDKNENGFSIHEPEKFISHKSLERRKKGSLYVTSEDLPVSKKYTDSITRLGLKLIHTSRWFNGGLFYVTDESLLAGIKTLTFVKKIEKRSDAVEAGKKTFIIKNVPEKNLYSTTIDTVSYYGMGYNQQKMIHSIDLHLKGFKGKGITIAVIDAGFTGYSTTWVFDSLIAENRILGYRDFVDPENANFNQNEHGTIVLGTLAANQAGFYIGGAPEASYWLLRSEETKTEYPSEEDNWVAAIEFADSVGAELANTSLGYFSFDNPVYNHQLSDLNGKKLRISIAAKMAAERGMLLTISAGNSGREKIPNIGAPADASDIITVGAVDKNGVITAFSSLGIGPQIKPEVVAQGSQIATFNNGIWIAGSANGTSFSSPIVCGAAACLINAFPKTPIKKIREAIITTANRYDSPNLEYGYGIPNFEAAYYYLLNHKNEEGPGIAYPTIIDNYFIIKPSFSASGPFNVECFNVTGQELFSITSSGEELMLSTELSVLSHGVHFFKCSKGSETRIFKAIKLK